MRQITLVKINLVLNLKKQNTKQKDNRYVHLDLLYYFVKIDYTMINMNQLYLEVKGKWKSLYPIYFDSSKTIKQGRRLSKQLCVQSPTLQQLAKALIFCQLRHIIEPHKSYSRNYLQTGRIKVQLCKENGKPIHAHIPNKKTILIKVAQRLRKLRQK